MKTRMIGLAIVGIMLVAMIGMIMPVSADSSHYLMYTGQTKSFCLTKGDTAEVSYYPGETGTKWLWMWHTSWQYGYAIAPCSLYWTNNGGVNWHYFADSGALAMPTFVRLYSGSSNIGFKIVYSNPYMDVVKIHMKAN